MYMARTRDRQFVVKQLTRSEKQSFLQSAPEYFRHVASPAQPTCLSRVLGLFQVVVRPAGQDEAAAEASFCMDFVVTENLFFGRKAEPGLIYDLKGSVRARYVTVPAPQPAAGPEAPGGASGVGSVLQDENLLETLPRRPLLVDVASHERFLRGVWRDTAFLAGLGVMDYSLIIHLEQGAARATVGIIDYLRQYTWDKKVESWVKSSGLLGGGAWLRAPCSACRQVGRPPGCRNPCVDHAPTLGRTRVHTQAAEVAIDVPSPPLQCLGRSRPSSPPSST